MGKRRSEQAATDTVSAVLVPASRGRLRLGGPQGSGPASGRGLHPSSARVKYTVAVISFIDGSEGLV